MYRNGVLLRIERLLSLHRLPQFFVSFRERNGTNPGHDFELPFCVSTPYTLGPAVANSWKMLPGPGTFLLILPRRALRNQRPVLVALLESRQNAGGLGCRKTP